MDIRWKLMQGLLYCLTTIGRKKGRFVFAVAAKPELNKDRVALAVADTTAIPAGAEVRALVDKIVEAHIAGLMKHFVVENGPEVKIEHGLPSRSWKESWRPTC